jgi:plasmid maintenance system antidote protein VapI
MSHLIDYLLSEYNIRNDAELARVLQVPPPTISKLRNGRTSLQATMILRIHDTFGMSIANIKRIAYGV